MYALSVFGVVDVAVGRTVEVILFSGGLSGGIGGVVFHNK